MEYQTMVDQMIALRIPREKAEARAQPGAMPRACWTCEYWSDVKRCCRRWDATPPEEIQKVGCETWKEADVPF